MEKSLVRLLILFVTLWTVVCRRYDLEEESQKLYHDDFKSVLQRFRRSYEYSNILQYKKEKLINQLQREMFYKLYNEEKVILERMEEQNGSKKNSAGRKGSSKSHRLQIMNSGRRNPYVKKPIDIFKPKGQLRQEAPEERNLTDVEILQNYDYYTQNISMKERRHLRSQGYELAKEVAQKIMYASGAKAECFTSILRAGPEDTASTKEIGHRKHQTTEKVTTSLAAT